VAAPWVLDEDDALELLAYLVTSARTQVDEAAEYGPMRLLTAAHRLAEAMGPRSTAETADALTESLAGMPLLAVPRGDRTEYVEQLDAACRSMAAHLRARYVEGPE
jgi:hypothetical protein